MFFCDNSNNNNNNNNNNNIPTRGGSGETVKHTLYNLLVLVQIVFLCVSAPFLCSCTLYAVLCKVRYNNYIQYTTRIHSGFLRRQ